MRNLILFKGSCGHTTVREINNEQWMFYTRSEVANRIRTGKRTRTVYVNPWMYCVCIDCMYENDLESENI